MQKVSSVGIFRYNQNINNLINLYITTWERRHETVDKLRLNSSK